MKSNDTLTRRSFLGSAAIAAAVAAHAPIALADETQGGWDEEHELVFVGSGGALFAALAAHKEGRDVVVLEKRGTYGGSMFLSAGAIWAPNNNMMSEANKAQESAEKCVEYLKEVDLYGAHDEAMMADWVSKCNSIYDYIVDELGIPLGEHGFAPHDYYDYPHSGSGRTIWIPDGEGKTANHAVCWMDTMAPVVDSSGLDIRLSTPAVRLVTEDDAVVGVVAQSEDGSELRIQATCGVVIATGSFDHNQDMVGTYLMPPLVGSQIPEACTGDGHLMGMAVGADVANMGYNYGCCLVDLGLDEQFASMNVLNNSIIVDRDGRRFCNETCSYDELSHIFEDVARSSQGHPYCYSGNVTGVYDSIGLGWAKKDLTDLPDYVREYATLEELAEGEGLDAETFAGEVARYNDMCEQGVDEDFHRCEGPFDNPQDGLYGSFLTLTPVSTPPFYAATLGRGSLGTSGGLVVDEEARVLRGGEPIEGLYASGCASDALVTGYPGAGFPIAMAITRAFIAADHALGLGIVKAE